jgi:hypothetical protein
VAVSSENHKINATHHRGWQTRMPYAFREPEVARLEEGRRCPRLKLLKALVSFENSEENSFRKRASLYSQILATAPINPTEVIVC